MPTIHLTWPTAQDTGWGSVGKGIRGVAWRAGWRCTDPDDPPDDEAALVLASAGNTVPQRSGCPDARHVAYVVAESTTWQPDDMARLRAYDRVLAGCTWTREALAAHGVEAAAWPQGVQCDAFPVAQPRTPDGTFRVFSGGKFEYRKGHDLVIEAFRQLQAAVPHAVLVTCWDNPWPSTIGPVHRTGYLTSLPPATHGDGLARWLEGQGVHRAEVHGSTPHHAMADLLAGCDAGLFLSRAEGNTNLAMMECAAMGIPTISSGHTGLAEVRHGVSPVRWVEGSTRTIVQGHSGVTQGGWRDPDPTEAADHLRAVARGGWVRDAEALRVFRERWDWSARWEVLEALVEPYAHA